MEAVVDAKGFLGSEPDAQPIMLFAGVGALTDGSLSPAALTEGSLHCLQLSWVSRLPSAGAPEGRALTSLLCRVCRSLRAAQTAQGTCATRLGDSQRANEGSHLQGELLKGPHHLCGCLPSVPVDVGPESPRSSLLRIEHNFPVCLQL